MSKKQIKATRSEVMPEMLPSSHHNLSDDTNIYGQKNVKTSSNKHFQSMDFRIQTTNDHNLSNQNSKQQTTKNAYNFYRLNSHEEFSSCQIEQMGKMIDYNPQKLVQMIESSSMKKVNDPSKLVSSASHKTKSMQREKEQQV